MPPPTHACPHSQLYNKRLLQLRPATEAAAASAFDPKYVKVDKAIDLKEGRPSYLVGTLYKTMKLKPSALDDYKDIGDTAAAAAPLSDYTDDGDSVVLEDETGRVILALDSSAAAAAASTTASSSSAAGEEAASGASSSMAVDLTSGRGALGSLAVHAVSTGLVVAVAGVLGDVGDFMVENWCAPQLDPRPVAGGVGVSSTNVKAKLAASKKVKDQAKRKAEDAAFLADAEVAAAEGEPAYVLVV